MKNSIFLINFVINVVFFVLNLKKVGLKRKSSFLPSTIFAGMWALSSLGVFLYSNGLGDEDDVRYWSSASMLEEIGNYQLFIFISIYLGFFLARLLHSNLSFSDFSYVTAHINILVMIKKFRWILWTYFLVGIFRLFLVVRTVGWNYALIRNFYNTTTYSSADLWLIRIGSYLMYAAYFYVALEGIKAAKYGINIKHIASIFVLYAPFQMSFGGRLFILSFFTPFFISYFIVRSFSSSYISKKADNAKLAIMGGFVFFLIIALSILKQGIEVNASTFGEYSTGIFYTSASYHYMNEFWHELPINIDYSYGLYSLGLTSEFFDRVRDGWIATGNNAIIATPSMIPAMLLDFGKTGSLFVYCFLFYLIESWGFLLLHKPSVKSLLVFLLLCAFCFSTTTSSMSDCIKSFVIGYILVMIINPYLSSRSL